MPLFSNFTVIFLVWRMCGATYGSALRSSCSFIWKSGFKLSHENEALRVLKISDWVNINRISYQFVFSQGVEEALFFYLSPQSGRIKKNRHRSIFSSLLTSKDILQLLCQTSLFGRACVHEPWAFGERRALWLLGESREDPATPAFLFLVV